MVIRKSQSGRKAKISGRTDSGTGRATRPGKPDQDSLPATDSEDTLDLPWGVRTRQEQGLKTEAEIIKKRGGRVHPRSGAGSIKSDGSSEETLYELKDAGKSHTIKGTDLEILFKRAVQQGKDAEYIVYFQNTDICLTGKITRGMK